MNSLYDKVIVIGYGVVTKDVLETVNVNKDVFGYLTEYVEYEVHPFNLATKYAVSNDIKHLTIEDIDELSDYFLEEAKRYKLLIISASNNYLFPKALIELDNVTIINFHNALLPDYPGRNAPSWVIYNGEKKTGITWHYVSESVDAGDIIAQKEIVVDDDMKAYQLSAELMKLAAEAFDEVYSRVLTGDVETIKQNIDGNARKIYKSWEVPADGFLDLASNVENIYRILRALDYGKSGIFPPPTAELDGKKVHINRYKVVADKDYKDNRLYLNYKDKYLMLSYTKLQ